MAEKYKLKIIDKRQKANFEIDYDKLADAIVKAQSRCEKETAAEKENQENRIKAFTEMGLSDYIDDTGRRKRDLTKRQNFKMIIKMVFAKERSMKLLLTDPKGGTTQNNLLPIMVNAMVSFLFLFMEWAMYGLGLFFGIKSIVTLVSNIITGSHWLFLIKGISDILFSVCAFFYGAVLFRLLKISSSCNEDNNYMINFLAVIVSVVAIVISLKG